jgi:Flp pilus assembly protein TadD
MGVRWSTFQAFSLLARIGVVAGAAGMALAGCASLGIDPPPAELTTDETAGSGVQVEPRARTAQAERPVKLAAAPKGALAEARALRQAGNRKAALDLLERVVAEGKKDRALEAEHALMVLESGDALRAEKLLKPLVARPSADWRLHSAYGSALAAIGRHPDAQIQFAKALELAPEHPAVLNNLALSYALDGRPEDAERLLRQVTASREAGASRIGMAKENLTLLLAVKPEAGSTTKVSQAAAVRPGSPATASPAGEPQPGLLPPSAVAALGAAAAETRAQSRRPGMFDEPPMRLGAGER